MLFKAAIFCCFIAVTLAADEHKSKKKDVRGKRNLEYSISHHYNVPNHRLERRISTSPQISRYPPFFPGQRPTSYRKGRPQSLPPPPYAVQMEPLVQYSQRDPLYDTNLLVIPTVGQNELAKNEDLLTDNNHVSESVYGPPKHVIERPVYLKEPEPIIEIIIKESNVTLPPVPVPRVTPAPKKKEQVQVFYVKYKKNPNGYGKDSVIYEKPIPAISPKLKEDEEEEVHQEYIPAPEYVTSAPPPSTTLRAIIKPESETYHAHKGIHITFGSEHDYERSHDDVKEESAPLPAVSFPQGREFHGNFQKRAPVQNGPPNFRPEGHRLPQSYRPFNQPPPPPPPPQSQLKLQYPQFGRKIPPQLQVRPPSPNPPPPFQPQPPTSHVQFQSQPPNRNPQFPLNSRPPPSPQFNQQIPVQQNSNFRQPVPYKPFDQIRPQQDENNFQFPRPHTHFPVRQELPLSQPPTAFSHPQSEPLPHGFAQQNIFNQQQQLPLVQQQNSFSKQQFSQDIKQFQQPQPLFNQQPQSPQQQSEVQRNQQQIFQDIQQQQRHLQFQQQQQEQQEQLRTQQQLNQQHLNNLQQNQHIIPPGGELIQSVPRYEQHISVPVKNEQQIPQALALQQNLRQADHLTPAEYSSQIQQQFKQNAAQNNNQHEQRAEQFQHPSLQQQSLQQQSFQQQQSLQQQSLQQQSLQQQSLQQQAFQQQALQQQALQQQALQQSLQQQQQRYQQQYNQQFSSTQAPATTQKVTYKTTTARPATTTTEKQPETTTKDLKSLNLELPDEVPDELREQLLSSGILNHASISVLDYDKVGDIPLSALPPDQLANFYNAGGGEQIAAGSAPSPSVVKNPGPSPKSVADLDMSGEGSEVKEVKVKNQSVEMKVVHYDPETDEGQKIQESYVKDDSKQVDPVVLNDQSYNRYLPLKVSGAQFPIPDIMELKGKKINSVVVLAPVDYNFKEGARVTRNVPKDLDNINFASGSALKELIANPSRENYFKFLDSENKTASDKQSVILLVTGDDKPKEEREIFMYDVATQTVSKLSGELSSAFVDAAEANADKSDDPSVSASNLVEVRVPSPNDAQLDRMDDESTADLEDAPSDIVETRIPIIDPMVDDLAAEGSEQLESFIDISGQDLTASDTRNSIENEVRIETGYSKTGYSMPLN